MTRRNSFLGFGALLALYLLFTMGQVAMTRRWPATTGTIEQAGVESQRVRDGGRRRSRADAVIHYSYTVDGKD